MSRILSYKKDIRLSVVNRLAQDVAVSVWQFLLT